MTYGLLDLDKAHREWPEATARTGEVIDRISRAIDLAKLSSAHKGCFVNADVLQRWHDCVLHLAALLDKDNPPLTPEELARMKPRERK